MKIKCDVESLKKAGVDWLAVGKAFLKGFASATGALIAYIVFLLVVVWYIRKSKSDVANAIRSAVGYSRPAMMLREADRVPGEIK